MPASTNIEMIQAADYAVQVAKEKFGRELDYSENSLPVIDQLIEQASQQYRGQVSEGKTSENVVNQTANIWGSYLGEVMRRKWGGEWIIESDAQRYLLVNGNRFYPALYTYKRITGEIQDTIEQYFAEIATKLSPPPADVVQTQPNQSNDTIPDIKKGGENITRLTRHIEKQIDMLQSPRAKTRYEACENLRVAPTITPEAIQALQSVLNDPDQDVAEAAQDALNVHLSSNMPRHEDQKMLDESGRIKSNEKRTGENGYATALRVIAVVIFLGGFVTGLEIGNVPIPGYSAPTGFSFTIAIPYWAIAIISGTLLLGFAEIISLLQKIVDSENHKAS